MEKIKRNRINDDLPPFPKMTIPWEKSKNEVWDALSDKLVEKTTGNERKVITMRVFYAVAATFLLLLSVGSFMRFYTSSTKAETFSTVKLPDNSTVTVNPGTEISFNPYWWNFNREVRFEGDGRFEVKKGEKFTVKSEKGSISVLGTVFTVNTFGENYSVSCESGSVKVVSHVAESEVVLATGQNARMNEKGLLEMNREDTKNLYNDIFNFTSESLEKVITEISQAYGICIKAEGINDLLYTGNFSKDTQINDVLQLICRPFGLKIEQVSEKEYILRK